MCAGRLFLIALTWVGLASLSTAFVSLPFNTTYFGPDGPWQAVVVRISYPGAPSQAVNLYPYLLSNTYAAFYVPTTGAGISPPNNLNHSNWASFYFSDSHTEYAYYFNGSVTQADVKITNNITLTRPKVDICDVAEYTYPNGATRTSRGWLHVPWR